MNRIFWGPLVIAWLGFAAVWLTGCVTGLGGVTTEQTCDLPGQELTYTLPDDSPETLAGLTIVRTMPDCMSDAIKTEVIDPKTVLDGVVTVECSTVDCDGRPGSRHETISFVLQ